MLTNYHAMFTNCKHGMLSVIMDKVNYWYQSIYPTTLEVNDDRGPGLSLNKNSVMTLFLSQCSVSLTMVR